MATNDSELMNEVRELTDYSSAVLPDSKLQTVISVAKREVEGVADTSVSDWYGTRNAELALFWTACLFCKIKAGEIDGVNMSLGDMETESLSAAGGYSESPVVWYERAMSYAQRLMPDTGRFSHRSVGRRSYGDDDSSTTL